MSIFFRYYAVTRSKRVKLVIVRISSIAYRQVYIGKWGKMVERALHSKKKTKKNNGILYLPYHIWIKTERGC